MTGSALIAFLPTMLSENGFTGANAQVATLAPYGASAVIMMVLCFGSDRYQNRGWFIQAAFVMSLIGFAIWTAGVTNRGARFFALIMSTVGHYVAVPLVLIWQAQNAGNESRRAVAVPMAASIAQCVAIGSGYLFPATDSPNYLKGSAVCLGLQIWGIVVCGIYQYLIRRENARRDQRDGVPDPTVKPDTLTYADAAVGFRYAS